MDNYKRKHKDDQEVIRFILCVIGFITIYKFIISNISWCCSSSLQDTNCVVINEEQKLEKIQVIPNIIGTKRITETELFQPDNDSEDSLPNDDSNEDIQYDPRPKGSYPKAKYRML